MSATLTERRKADRQKMADRVHAIAAHHGATVTRENEGECFLGPRAVLITIEAARGLRVGIDFDGASPQPDVHVLAWHIAPGSDARLSPRFGNINPYHQRKCTTVAYGIDALCRELADKLTMARDGSAFDIEQA